MEVRKNEEMRRCSRCMMKGDKMCYQHIVSYLFPISKRNHEEDSAKFDENTSNPSISNGVFVGSLKIDEKNSNPSISNGDFGGNLKIDEKDSNPSKFNGDYGGNLKIDEKNSNPLKFNGNFVGSLKIDEEKDVGFVRKVEEKKCTPGVCKNSPLEITLTKLKEKLIRNKRNEGEDGEKNVSVGVKRGRGEEKENGVSRKKFRLISEEFGGFGCKSQGLGSVFEGKMHKFAQNLEEEDDGLLEDFRHEEEEIEQGAPGVCENGAEENTPKIDKRIKIDSSVCHQCHRGDKGRVIRCNRCKTRRFCIPCIITWYPQMSEDKIALACPICRGNCNCKSCLRMQGPYKNQVKGGYNIRQEVKIDHSKILLRTILPFLKQFHQEQMSEKEIEAKIQGVPVSEVEILNAIGRENERVICNNCRSSIVDFHRSCPNCMYDLCLTCCREVRAGQLQGSEEVMTEFVNRDLQQHGKSSRVKLKKQTRGYNAPTKSKESAKCKGVHAQSKRISGGKDAPAQSKMIHGCSPKLHFDDQSRSKSEWKAEGNGAITCPPSVYEGCDGAFLELKSVLSDGWVSELLKKAEQTVAKWEQENTAHPPDECSCSTSNADGGSTLQKCASREGSKDNYLYCPDARDLQNGDLKHFRWHWTLGEPIIVRSSLETSPGLSWEPMVMWRAFREVGNRVVKVKAIKCSDWSEVDLKSHQFFKDYSRGWLEGAKGPGLLKLKDWPPFGKFEQRLPRHSAEFITALPFKEYTHPKDGVMNLFAKLPSRILKPDLGLKAYIAYGRSQELGCGDSVTKLHCHMSDVVNILTHTAEGTLHLGRGACPSGILEGSENKSEGAIWDIFRREDVLKLQEYLKGHYMEFWDNHHSPFNQLIHPIHDQSFYLAEEHKRKLKEEYGIEPWTFIQKLGEAILIPAGCPHQVRNLKSCIKVALDFVSPESVAECIRLTGELRSLPQNHQAKEDKSEVWKMIIYAVNQAVKDLKT